GEVQREGVGPEPEQRRHQPKPLRSIMLPHGLQKLLRGEDAVRADEAADLHPQRRERDEVDDAQGAQEHPFREHVGGAARRHAHHPPRATFHRLQDGADRPCAAVHSLNYGEASACPPLPPPARFPSCCPSSISTIPSPTTSSSTSVRWALGPPRPAAARSRSRAS